MIAHTPTPVPQDIEYPDCDGQPMSDNTLQFRWIVTIEGNLENLFADRPDVFVAGDLLWYPVEGNNVIRMAPDALVAFGRPKGYRGSYMQWREENIAPQVVWEVLSPSNRAGELANKFAFYQHHGVEEYYQYDPDRGVLRGWRRLGGQLREIETIQGWISPRLGVRMEVVDGELQLFFPNGQKFETFQEVYQQLQAAKARAEQEQREREAAQARADQERREREAAQARADEERHEREAAQARAERLAQRLRALGIDPDMETPPVEPG